MHIQWVENLNMFAVQIEYTWNISVDLCIIDIIVYFAMHKPGT